MKVMMAIKCGVATPEKWQKLFSENKVPRFGDMPQNEHPRKMAKAFF
jgi:hypothetical protein